MVAVDLGMEIEEELDESALESGSSPGESDKTTRADLRREFEIEEAEVGTDLKVIF